MNYKVILLVISVMLFTAYCSSADPVIDFADIDYSVPHGFDTKKVDIKYGETKTVSYYSTVSQNDRNVTIILPPDYSKEKKYPVLYLLHGIGGNEYEWLGGNPSQIVSNLVADDKVREMIIVIPNIRVRHASVTETPEFFSVEHFCEFDAFLNELKNCLMPYVEKNYPVLSERKSRAVAGLSMGGRSALHVGINLVEDFAYIGAFTPAVGILPYAEEEGLFTKETLTLPDKYAKNTLIMIVKGSNDGVVHHWPEKYSETLNNNGVNHIYYVAEGGHDFSVWKNSLYNFTRRIFK